MLSTTTASLLFGCLLIGSIGARTSNTGTANSLQQQPTGGANSAKHMLENALLKLSRLNEIVPSDGEQVPCTCGVFLNGQFDKGSTAPPRGNAALLHEQDVMLPCNVQGNKQCTNRCLEMIVKHLPNSPNIICGTIDRDCHRERAYLFIQNCNSTWINTKLSAGREYCCKGGTSVPCSLIH